MHKTQKRPKKRSFEFRVFLLNVRSERKGNRADEGGGREGKQRRGVGKVDKAKFYIRNHVEVSLNDINSSETKNGRLSIRRKFRESWDNTIRANRIK